MSEKVLDITKDERMHLSMLKRRPGAFWGRIELTRFLNWVNGYEIALGMTKLYSERVLLPDLNDYAAIKYLGHTRTALNCFHIILEKEPDEEKAFDLFWELLDEYLVGLGYKPIPDWDSIREEWGQEYIKRTNNTCEKNRNITNDERMLLSSLKRRPGMYLGTTALTNFLIWIFGYKEALKITGLYSERVILPDGFQDYTAMKYLGYTKTAMGWASLILEKEPDEKKAFDVFWELLDEYLVSQGYEPIPLYEDTKDEWEKWRTRKKT
ncbi:MAG: hypothetical protein K2N71_09305 [Oscillospiraceae bacterium]|nr:hypothetical protein [Oscillospiraceae bacterium]